MKKLFFVIGASGSGKTTAATLLEKQCSDMHVAYFDSIGVPSFEEMVRQYGSAEEWQRGKTIDWVTTLKNSVLQEKRVLLDGQTRPLFIQEACQQNGITNYTIILFDCSDDERKRRLNARGQPELYNADMVNWAAYLRTQAKQYGCQIIDTTMQSTEKMTQTLHQEIQSLER